ncbi:conserved hypothetical protein [Leishmania major strain Friedlin]|uniref:Uncharacterized protein n=1 Tax=Leishmania major TaxID=5664 RepID=Q4QAB1_LEIMA|nr:conserved hypothetical protein [Leishmania major strain Friedlin]CAG9574725.1 hypothetical_protein_-_conserved [Leishmania major strain Friedlin]CAJ05387.1 conserved hypothetical protein [Leishmania major strain Friedlin]|eukprot:XP_001683737.1 conserved hypothetical protein [Leishmania major strain Friedlin]
MAPKTRSGSNAKKRGRIRDAAETPQPSRGSASAAEKKSKQRSQSARAEAKRSVEGLEGKAAAFVRRYKWWFTALLAIVLVFAAARLAVLLSPSGDASPQERHPCSCAVVASTTNRLAKAVLSRRTGVSGVHWRTEETGLDSLAFATQCSGGAVVTLPGPFESVDQLRAALMAPFKGRRNRCVVWVTTPEAVKRVANSLKELIENNALSGNTVVPAHSRATLMLKSPESREQLKSSLPHRVVHMLTEV